MTRRPVSLILTLAIVVGGLVVMRMIPGARVEPQQQEQPTTDPQPDQQPEPEQPTTGTVAADGFTILRRETFSCGGQTHTVEIYRCEAFAEAIGLNPHETAADVEFVLVPGGEFMMGSPASEANRHANEDQHQVTVASFLIARTELSQRVWSGLATRAGVPPNNSSFKGNPMLPVETVSWNECDMWCRAAGVRMPSEAEWEYACRAGTTTPFTFGANINTKEVHYDGRMPYAGGAKSRFLAETLPVGSFPANAFGLHEVHGNVNEWCQDYAGLNEKAPADGNALTLPNRAIQASPRSNPSRPNPHSCRGGSWVNWADACRSAWRSGAHWNDAPWDCIGLRPAASIR